MYNKISLFQFKDVFVSWRILILGHHLMKTCKTSWELPIRHLAKFLSKDKFKSALMPLLADVFLSGFDYKSLETFIYCTLILGTAAHHWGKTAPWCQH